MGYVYDQTMRQLYAESRARSFIEFVHGDPDDLKAVVVILEYCAKPKTYNEMFAHLRACGAAVKRIDRAMAFIREQRLYEGTGGRIQAIKGATTEIVYRLEHDGAESPRPDPYEQEAARLHKALAKVNVALAEQGYRNAGKRRLRVVKCI